MNHIRRLLSDDKNKNIYKIPRARVPKKNRIKAWSLLVFAVILLIVGLIGSLRFYHFGAIEMKSTLTAEVNSKVRISDFINKIEDDGSLAKNPLIDTKHIGEYPTKAVIDFPDKARRKVIDFTISIVDTTKPRIKSPKRIELKKGEPLTIKKYVDVKDNSLENVEPTIEGNYNTDEAGTYSVDIVARDESGNEAKAKTKIIVKEESKHKKDSKKEN